MQPTSFKFLVLDLAERFSDKITNIFGPKPSRVYLNGDSWFTAAQEKAALKTSQTLAPFSHKCSNDNLLRRCPAEHFALPCVPQPVSDWDTPSPPRRRSSASSRLGRDSSSSHHSMIDLDFGVPVLDTTRNVLTLKTGVLRRSAPIESKPGFQFTVTPATPINQSHSHFSGRVHEAEQTVAERIIHIIDRECLSAY
ncbi:hypothetical protein FIBSPDRAFT_965379 [Athelia psychrophila]|uniref:Uncharacterized protein n=1 Tax=Athelia psychrophila TaxID=1759441 RepID=A0A165WLN1_9AGAM|nr:hypothetical protein FIBSPDRAFT_965379 [Fibularhizoctonia sp. CBS 109695]